MILTGFEPSKNVAREAKAKGHKVISNFFNAEEFKKEFGSGKAKIITAIGMFYDMDDPGQFITDAVRALTPEGIFIAQLMTAKQMLEKNDVGNICHEHLEYFSYSSLKYLFEKNGLEISDLRV